MTRAKVEKAVKAWQVRLGLQAWGITVHWGRDEICECSDDADATTWRSNDYDRARVYPSPKEFGGWSDDYMNRVIVHELLHLVTREIDRTFFSIDGQLHPDAYRMAEKRYDHEIEGLVDRLAARFVDLGGCA